MVHACQLGKPHASLSMAAVQARHQIGIPMTVLLLAWVHSGIVVIHSIDTSSAFSYCD